LQNPTDSQTQISKPDTHSQAIDLGLKISDPLPLGHLQHDIANPFGSAFALVPNHQVNDLADLDIRFSHPTFSQWLQQAQQFHHEKLQDSKEVELIEGCSSSSPLSAHSSNSDYAHL